MANLRDPLGVYPETTDRTESADRFHVRNLHLYVLRWRAR